MTPLQIRNLVTRNGTLAGKILINDAFPVYQIYRTPSGWAFQSNTTSIANSRHVELNDAMDRMVREIHSKYGDDVEFTEEQF